MKLFIYSIIFLACFDVETSLRGTTVWRYPPISNSFFDHVIVTWDEAYFQFPSREMHVYEGEVTAPDTSSFGVNEFFIVYTGVAPGYGAIIRLSPFGLGTQGITNSTASFVKILPAGIRVPIEVTLTNIGSMPPLGQRSYLPDGYIADLHHIGSFDVDGMRVWIRIRYLGNPESPVVDLTWGVGAGPGNPGKVSDDYDRPRLETIGRPVERSIMLESRTGGIYVTVRAPDEGFALEHAENIPDWVQTSGPQSVSGFNYFYRFPVPGSTNKMFFRTK